MTRPSRLATLIACLGAGTLVLTGCGSDEPFDPGGDLGKGTTPTSVTDVLDALRDAMPSDIRDLVPTGIPGGSDRDGSNEGGSDEVGSDRDHGPSLPEGFPAQIPLPDLPIASATSLTTTRGWIVNFRTDDQAEQLDRAHSALNDAGYADVYWAPENGNGLVRDATHKVEVLLSDDKPWISFVVRPAD